jgi:hypothetical protein
MFVRDIHIVDDPKGMGIGAGEKKGGITMVRLQRLDDLSASVRDSVYLSLVFSNFVFRHGLAQVDRKLNRSRLLGSLLSTGEFPRDVVQARTQVVNDFSNKNTEPPWDDSLCMRFNRFLDGFRVIIGDTWVRPIIKEDRDFSFKIQDVLVGPF